VNKTLSRVFFVKKEGYLFGTKFSIGMFVIAVAVNEDVTRYSDKILR